MENQSEINVLIGAFNPCRFSGIGWGFFLWFAGSNLTGSFA